MPEHLRSKAPIIAPFPVVTEESAATWAVRKLGAGPTQPATLGRSAELVQQRLRLLKIGCVEALGEPAVNRCQQIARFGPPALPLSEVTRAGEAK